MGSVFKRDEVVDLNDVFIKAHDKIYEEFGERVPISVIKRVFESQLIGTKLGLLELRKVKWSGLGCFRLDKKRKARQDEFIRLKNSGVSGVELRNAMREFMIQYNIKLRAEAAEEEDESDELEEEQYNGEG
jgi:hypothetical protein